MQSRDVSVAVRVSHFVSLETDFFLSLEFRMLEFSAASIFVLD